MSTHTATISWKRAGDFLAGKYSREHVWTFDGGATVASSASPSIVPLPYSNPAGIDPEEAYVAAIASCHMLWFLHMAQYRNFVVESYRDEAVGTMTKDSAGVLWISAVTLNPVIVYGGERRPDPAEEERLHHDAHARCFIANSVKTEIRVGATTFPGQQYTQGTNV